ncbi:hypothetical protein [Ruminococcus sp. Marseille-P6503]|uniref:hypothetical protein n=1 Tax=Ruminococcus sp. Marseille-P6503 TaxID=2364796 RepID=UPI000F5314B3|nr:hypothetical protein [Ruminococcus sp. Marseille-P6503]
MKRIKKAAIIALAVVLAAPLGFKLFNERETVIIDGEEVPLLKSFYHYSISIQDDVPVTIEGDAVPL